MNSKKTMILFTYAYLFFFEALTGYVLLFHIKMLTNSYFFGAWAIMGVLAIEYAFQGKFR